MAEEARPVTGAEQLDRHGLVGAAHGNLLRARLQRHPAARSLVLPALAVSGVGSGPATLDEEVSVVDHGARDAPADVSVVAVVREARHARKGEPDRVEVGALDVRLVIDRGRVAAAVRVASDERHFGRRVLATEREAEIGRAHV